MKGEEVILVMKDLIKEVNNLIHIQNNQSEMLNGLMNKGLIFEKRVSKFALTSGAIYVPKRLIGKSFKVILIPLDVLPINIEDLPKRASKNYGNKIAEIVGVPIVEKEVNNEVRKRLI